MDDQPTCGKELARHAPLPAKLSELTAAVAEVLALHTKALDLTDVKARREYDVYQKLVREHRDAAAALHAIAHEMAGQRDLAMGRHDAKAMADPRNGEAFAAFVRLEGELVALLQNRIEKDQAMLAQMSPEP